MNSNGNSDEHMITKKGSYSYLSPEGQTISMEYVADETGFHPKGDHLPVAPENTLEVVQAIREFEAAYELAAKANPESAQNNGYISPSNY
ncbi:unnamed protein product [Allacma fusca]|uniref:Uncharacterized protein n=1 Tax=Allacma fusca TaxID=39272 RepID=A0A8J2L5T4_9HEXA|nr:unnamed protein product [Allacma fusca]